MADSGTFVPSYFQSIAKCTSYYGSTFEVAKRLRSASVAT